MCCCCSLARSRRRRRRSKNSFVRFILWSFNISLYIYSVTIHSYPYSRNIFFSFSSICSHFVLCDVETDVETEPEVNRMKMSGLCSQYSQSGISREKENMIIWRQNEKTNEQKIKCSLLLYTLNILYTYIYTQQHLFYFIFFFPETFFFPLLLFSVLVRSLVSRLTRKRVWSKIKLNDVSV